MGTFVTSSDALPTARTNRPGTGAATQTYHWDATHANYAWNAASDLRNHAPRWINVKSTAYGAVGDGVTNDTVAIQAALTAAAAVSGGCVVYFPRGTYLYGGASGALTVTASNIWIVGEGQYLTTLSFTVSGSTGTALTIGQTGAGVSNCGIRLANFRVLGTSSAARGIDIVRMQGVTAENIAVQSFSASGAAGLRLRGSNSCQFLNLDARQNDYGVELATISGEKSNLNLFDGGQWTGNVTRGFEHTDGESNYVRAVNISSTGASPAVRIKQGINTVIDGCFFEGNATGASTCHIQLGDSSHADFVSNGAQIIHNEFLDTPTWHVQVQRGVGNGIDLNHVGGVPTAAVLRTEANASQTHYLWNVNPGSTATALSEGSSSLDTFDVGPECRFKKTNIGFLFNQPLSASSGSNLKFSAASSGDKKIVSGQDELENEQWALTRNVRGTVTITDPATSANVTFTTAEADTNYRVTMGLEAPSGSPTITAPYITSKATGGFTINLPSAPGGGLSVVVPWHLIR